MADEAEGEMPEVSLDGDDGDAGGEPGELEAEMFGSGDGGEDEGADNAAAPEPAPTPEPESAPAEVEADSTPAEIPAEAPSSSAEAPAAATPASSAPAAKAVKKEAVKPYTFSVKVTSPERIGDGMGSYIVYKIVAKTTMGSYKTPDLSVSRRFSDFFNLQAMLSHKYQGVVIPACPPKDAMRNGVMKFKTQGEEITPFVERRQHALQRFLRRLVAHPALVDDALVHKFFETDEKIPKPASDPLALITSKFPAIEIDEWFDDKLREMHVLDKQLKKLHAAVTALCDSRKELAGQTVRFAEAFAALADAEELPKLTTAMHRLADVEAKVGKCHAKQSTRDFYDFSEIIFDYVMMVQSALVALAQRNKKLKHSQDMDSNLTRKQDAEAKLKANPAAKPEKVDQAGKDVRDAETKAKEAQEQYIDIARIAKRELERFDINKVREFQQMCISYIEDIMSMEAQVVKEWENFLPEAKAIPL